MSYKLWVSTVSSYVLHSLGRCCRLGQEKQTRFYVLWVKGDTQDEIAMLMRDKRITATLAMTQIDPGRLDRPKKRKNT
jgi:hypothetical protein